jgi:dephospho-CoA kinase
MKIGFVGEMATGKTAMAEYFMEKFQAKKVSFADALKQDVIRFNLTEDGTIQKPRDRKLLQDYGQLRRGQINSMNANGHEVVNKFNNGNTACIVDGVIVGYSNENHWLNQGIEIANKLSSESHSIVFDDIRFPNEAKMLLQNNFIIIRIFATENVRIQRLIARDGGYDPSDFNNVSETETKYLPINYMIDNSGTFDNTKEIFDEVIKRHTKMYGSITN